MFRVLQILYRSLAAITALCGIGFVVTLILASRCKSDCSGYGVIMVPLFVGLLSLIGTAVVGTAREFTKPSSLNAGQKSLNYGVRVLRGMLVIAGFVGMSRAYVTFANITPVDQAAILWLAVRGVPFAALTVFALLFNADRRRQMSLIALVCGAGLIAGFITMELPLLGASALGLILSIILIVRR